MRLLLTVAIIWGLMAAAGAPQTYSPQRPLPRTTSMPALRALATQREIEERFKLGIDAEARGEERGRNGQEQGREFLEAHCEAP